MEDHAQTYVSWISQRPDLARDTTLFLNVNNLYENNKDSPNAGKIIVFPNGVTPNNEARVSELPELLSKLSRPYSELITLARDLPAGEIDGDFFYQVCDAFWNANLQIPEYQYPAERYTGDVLAEFGARVVPTSYFTKTLELALSVAYAHSVLSNINPEKRNHVFDHKSGDKKVLPSLRWTNLIEHDKLTSEELRDVGRKIQKLEAKIKSTIEECPKPPIDNDPRAYAHSLKNTARDTTGYALRLACQKLGIPIASSRRMAKSGRKRLDDLSLFD